MQSFRHSLHELEIPTGFVWQLEEIAEAKGRQELYRQRAPQLLVGLREQARIQSVESSNRIEGVTVAAGRLVPLVEGRETPRDRPEEEIAGYRQALDLILTPPQDLAVTPKTLLRLHGLCMAGAGDAGQWKAVDNDIVELRPGQAPRIRFRCVPAQETPGAVEELCVQYRQTIEQRQIPAPVVVAALTLDLLCIHPFRDGNGRVSRLLTLLCLAQQGQDVGRYVSLERLIEESREEYYDVLYASSQGWHEGQHDLMPWLGYFLSILRRAWRELADRARQVRAGRGAKAELVMHAVRQQTGEFALADIQGACPGVGRDWIRRLLANLRKEGKATCAGRGRGARWRYVGE